MRGPRSAPSRAGFRLLGILIAAGMLAGCEEGRAPYPVIDPDAGPIEFLPEDGVQPGTTRLDQQIYRFDRTRYRLFEPLGGTESRFIFRDSVLALTAAGSPGAPLILRLRPDLSDPTLASVYADPRLFGFEPAPPAEAGFADGRTTTGVAEFFPTDAGNRWDLNHNGREWAVLDSIVGAGDAETANGMPVTRMVTVARARADLREPYQPAVYSYATDFTAAAGIGFYYHAWQLVSERIVPRDRRPPGTLLDRQRNPRFLWLPVLQSNDPTGQSQVSLDHCVDQLPGHLQFFPLKISDDEIREGTTYTTWTYLTIDPDALRERLDTEGMEPRGGRCGFEIVTGPDTLRMFPTRSFRLLCRFDVAVQRIANQITLTQGANTIGRYPRTASANSLVNFRITMSTNFGFGAAPVEILDLWFQRGIGPVIRENGVFGPTRSRARLRSAVVAGVVYPPNATNPAFEYFDE